MESEEISILKKKFFDSRHRSKTMKQLLREQRERSRQIITAFANKLQEKEEQIQEVMNQRDKELRFITQELSLLHSNLMKEQTKLRQTLHDKNCQLAQQETELKELRKQNKKLLLSNRAKLVIEDRDMDTPSSEENSPKSSFSKAPKAMEIKSRHVNSKLFVNGDSPDCKVKNEVVNVLVIDDSKQQQQPPPPPKLFPKGNDSVKPPVPSRAGVNRKLMNKPVQSGSNEMLSEIPPRPPARTTSVQKDFDSGRESDATDAESSLNLSHNINNRSSEELVPSNCSRSDEGFSSSHEGFSSSHEDCSGKPLPPPRSNGSMNCPNTLRQLTNHRAVQKPSDIKFRSKLRSSTIPPSPGTTLSVLDEQKVVSTSSCGSSGDVTTVTYWTEPYV